MSSWRVLCSGSEATGGEALAASPPLHQAPVVVPPGEDAWPLRAVEQAPRTRLVPLIHKPARLWNVFRVFPPNCVNLTNVIVLCELSEPIDKEKFLRAYPFCKLNRGNWGAITFRMMEPPLSGSIYQQMIMITGAISLLGGRYSAEVMLQMMRQCGYPNLCFTDFRVSNIAATVTFDFDVDIPAYNRASKSMLYIPENFIGAKDANKKRQSVSGMTVTVYEGKATSAGFKSAHEFAFDFTREYVKLRAHRKGASKEGASPAADSSGAGAGTVAPQRQQKRAKRSAGT